jgi:hypothetical protein
VIVSWPELEGELKELDGITVEASGLLVMDIAGELGELDGITAETSVLLLGAELDGVLDDGVLPVERAGPVERGAELKTEPEDDEEAYPYPYP